MQYCYSNKLISIQQSVSNWIWEKNQSEENIRESLNNSIYSTSWHHQFNYIIYDIETSQQLCKIDVHNFVIIDILIVWDRDRFW